MLKTYTYSLLVVILALALALPAAAQERGGDPYVVNTNYYYDAKLEEGFVMVGEGVDPDPGRGDDYTPRYNDYDWMITDPVGIRQSELDAFRARCASYAQPFGIDGIELVDGITELQTGINSVQLISNVVVKKSGLLMSSGFSIFFPPNYDPNATPAYPIVVQVPGFSTVSLNNLVFDPGGNSLPLGYLTSIQSYLNDPNGHGLVYIVWNAGGFGCIGANNDSRQAIGWLFRILSNHCGCDRRRVVAMGPSRGAFAVLTLAENVIHGGENYNVLGVFATSPPLSMGTLSTIPIGTNPDLANLYRIYGGPDGYLYSGPNPPGVSPQPALIPVFGTSDPDQADSLCPDNNGENGGADNVEHLQGKYVYLAAGTHDTFFPVTNFIGLDQSLSERGIDHTTFLIIQGGHGPSPKDRMRSIFNDFLFNVMADETFDPATYTPPAPFKHGIGEAARNYLVDTDLVTHRPENDQGESNLKTLFLKELPFSATMPRRLGCNVYGDGTPNVANEPGIVHLTGTAGKRWEINFFNPATSDLIYRTGIFDSSETAELVWWSDLFPLSASGYCGPGGGCTPDNDWLQWSALYEGDHATGNTNYIVDGNRIALETEVIDYQPLPRELRVLYAVGATSPSVALGVDLFPQVVAELRSSHTGGTAPLTVIFGMTMANNSEFYRRLAFRLDTMLANGNFLYNHRAGYTNVGPYDRFEASVNMNLPAFSSLHGENTFTLHTEDVTPAPYNQPPFLPAGAHDSSSVTIDVVVP